MAGNRKHGFLRGNANGRNGNSFLALKELQFQHERETRITQRQQMRLLLDVQE